MDATNSCQVQLLDGPESEQSGHRCGTRLDGTAVEDQSDVAGLNKWITVHVHPTTGGQFQLQTSAADSVDHLKKLISKKLKVPKDRICLLYRER